MKIRDLPDPVMAAKADWLAGTRWIGFTPADASLDTRESCRATINAQFRDGYVIEYITLTFGKVNLGFRDDPRYLEARSAHRDVARRLIAVSRPANLPEPMWSSSISMVHRKIRYAH